MFENMSDLDPPGREPVDLEYAKTYLRVDHEADDALINDLITAARIRIENHIGCSLIRRRRRYKTNRLSDSGVIINHSPVMSVHSVTVRGQDGSETELLPVDYTVDLNAVPAKVTLKPPFVWDGYGARPATVIIDLDAGYGPEPEDVPMPLRHAILLLIAQAYAFRDKDETPPFPMMADSLLMPYRSLRI